MTLNGNFLLDASFCLFSVGFMVCVGFGFVFFFLPLELPFLFRKLLLCI